MVGQEEKGTIAKLFVIFVKIPDISNPHVQVEEIVSHGHHFTSQPQKEETSSSEAFSLNQIVEALQPLLKRAISEAVVSSFSPPGKTSWLLNSGVSFHMSPNMYSLSEYSRNCSPSFVSTADGTSLEIKGVGNFEIQNFFIPKIRFIPKLNLNLLSVSQLSDYGCDIKFSSDKCLIQDHRSGNLIGKGSKEGRSYIIWTLFKFLKLHFVILPDIKT